MLTVGDQVIPLPELAGGRGGGHPRNPDLEGGRQRNVAGGGGTGLRAGGVDSMAEDCGKLRGPERLWE